MTIEQKNMFDSAVCKSGKLQVKRSVQQTFIVQRCLSYHPECVHTAKALLEE